jgi:glycosyltransferase involved in cell wall biosynthesis
VESKINRCIESLVNQSYKDIEIILVDDGSNDKSGEICDSWGNEGKRIRVIHKLNEGVGAARNTGLHHATGKYVGFVDSDDYVEQNMYEILVSAIQRTHADEVCCCVNNIYEDKIISEEHSFGMRNLESHDDIFQNLIMSLLEPSESKKAGLLQPIWNKLYIRRIIDEEKIYFDEKLPYAEDWLFNVNYYRFCQSVTFIEEHLYNYDRTTQDSLSKKFRYSGFNDSVRIRSIEKEWFPEFCTEQKYNELILKIHDHYIGQYARMLGLKGFNEYCLKMFENEYLKNACLYLKNGDNITYHKRMIDAVVDNDNKKYEMYAYKISFVQFIKHYIKCILV